MLPALIAAAIILGASGAAPHCRIYLGDEDPAGLDELPGILETELAALRDVSGTGSPSLGERLESTGIARERLRAWAPYLEVGESDAGRGAAAHVTAEAGGRRGRLDRSRTALAMHAGPILVDGVTRSRFRSSADGGGNLREARVRIEATSSVRISVGSLAPAIPGGQPWEDPLRRPGFVPGCPAPATVRSRASARGLVWQGPHLLLGGWSGRRAGRGGLAWISSRGAEAWVGFEKDQGGGGGIRSAIQGARLAASVHGPRASSPVLRVAAEDRERALSLAAAYPLGARSAGRACRIDGALSRAAGGWKLNARGTGFAVAVPGSGFGSSGLEVGAGRTAGPLRILTEYLWRAGGSRSRLLVEAIGDNGSLLRTEGRMQWRDHEVAAALSISASRSGRGKRLEADLCGILGPEISGTDRSAWPSLGRLAARLVAEIGGRRRGPVRVRGFAALPVIGWKNGEERSLSWGIRVDQRSESD